MNVSLRYRHLGVGAHRLCVNSTTERTRVGLTGGDRDTTGRKSKNE
jgi:hypothetical protein